MAIVRWWKHDTISHYHHRTIVLSCFHHRGIALSSSCYRVFTIVVSLFRIIIIVLSSIAFQINIFKGDGPNGIPYGMDISETPEAIDKKWEIVYIHIYNNLPNAIYRWLTEKKSKNPHWKNKHKKIKIFNWKHKIESVNASEQNGWTNGVAVL